MKYIIEACDIKYDTDGAKVKLPKKIRFEVDGDFDPDEELADLISNHTGWCVLSCDYKIINAKK